LKIGISSLYLINRPFSYFIKRIPELETNFIEIIDDGLHAIKQEKSPNIKEAC